MLLECLGSHCRGGCWNPSQSGNCHWDRLSEEKTWTACGPSSRFSKWTENQTSETASFDTRSCRVGEDSRVRGNGTSFDGPKPTT